jgi:hypothetical protein
VELTPYRTDARRHVTAQDVAFLEKYCSRARVGAGVLLGAWVVAVAFGGGRHELLGNLLGFAVGVDVLLWCVLDAPLHEKYFEHAFAVPFLLTWPVALAVYLVWTRGGRRGLTSYAGALLLGVGVVLVAAVLATCLVRAAL